MGVHEWLRLLDLRFAYHWLFHDITLCWMYNKLDVISPRVWNSWPTNCNRATKGRTRKHKYMPKASSPLLRQECMPCRSNSEKALGTLVRSPAPPLIVPVAICSPWIPHINYWCTVHIVRLSMIKIAQISLWTTK